MGSALSNRQLLIIAVVLAFISLAISLGRMLGYPATGSRQSLPTYPILLDGIDTGKVVNLTDEIRKADTTIVWMISTGCSRCDLAIGFCLEELRSVAASGTPIYFVFNKFSKSKLGENSDLFPREFSYYTMRLNAEDVLGATTTPSCYLIGKDGTILNRTTAYPDGWIEILEQLGIEHNSPSED